MAETSCLPCDKNSTVTIVLFTNITNTSSIRKALTEGKLDASLLTPHLIVNKFQALLAANKAYFSFTRGKKITKNINSEVIYSISPSKNISESFKNFGVREDDTSILAILFNDTDGQKLNKLVDSIGGRIEPLDKLESIYDSDAVKKLYKVTEAELSAGNLTDAVSQRIAIKDVV